MWVNRELFETILADNKATSERLAAVMNTCYILQTKHDDALTQKTKDDITIDWMRHRINALEKERTVLLQRAAGITLPTPEIEISKPRTIAPGFDHLPSFEDVGDAEALRLGLRHDDAGNLEYDGQTPTKTE